MCIRDRADREAEEHQQAAHGGRAFLAGMGRHFMQDVLAAFEAAQPGDEPGTQQDGEHQGRDERGHGTEGDVPENIERRPFGRPRYQQVIQHLQTLRTAAGQPVALLSLIHI